MRKLHPSELIEAAIVRKEGVLLENGAFCAHTGKFTGRSPKDKYFVADARCTLPKEQHQWLSEAQFERLLARMQSHFERVGGFVFDGVVNQHPSYQVPIRFYTEYAWHSLFVQRMFVPSSDATAPVYTVYGAPSLKADPLLDGTRSETFIVLHPGRNIILIGGTEYAGELKKSIFTMMHHHLAEQDVMPMHCSASIGQSDDVALFFGLSGTGKTTLSADPARRLIGDDEHGWGTDGVFNLEGGCYAKCIDLSREHEPDIYDAIHFGTVLENVVYNEERQPIYQDRTLTENTRAAYPLAHIRNFEPTGRGGHPKVVFFLSADASGVLPAVARLQPEDARMHYLLGYTSKLAGTERGIVSPEATFSACFAEPFLTDRPNRYADMLMERLKKYNVPVYLLSTGWVAGGYGETSRVPLTVTRMLVNQILRGELDGVEADRDEALHLDVPKAIEGVAQKYLHPEFGFLDAATYETRKRQMAESFVKILEGFSPLTV